MSGNSWMIHIVITTRDIFCVLYDRHGSLSLDFMVTFIEYVPKILYITIYDTLSVLHRRLLPLWRDYPSRTYRRTSFTTTDTRLSEPL